MKKLVSLLNKKLVSDAHRSAAADVDGRKLFIGTQPIPKELRK